MAYERPPVRIRVTIEPSWAYGVHTGVLKIPAGNLDGMDELERRHYLEKTAEEWVNQEASWGFRELGPGEDEDDAAAE